MARKRYTPEEIVGKLRQVEILHGQGMAMAEVIRQLGISEVTLQRGQVRGRHKARQRQSSEMLRRATRASRPPSSSAGPDKV